MGNLATEQIADWIEQDVRNDEWKDLRNVCYEVLRGRLERYADDELWDIVEERRPHLPELLANRLAELERDGLTKLFELDTDNGYIRRSNKEYGPLVERLRKVHPNDFEKICAEILSALGGIADVTQVTHDGGVDFYAFNLKHVSSALPLPLSAAFTVIGQAKRYKEDNLVTENEIRTFIGGAILRLDEFKKQRKLGPAQPVVFAFWTSSRLHNSAKEYSRKMGIWDMDGLAIVDYLVKLNLVDKVLNNSASTTVQDLATTQ